MIRDAVRLVGAVFAGILIAKGQHVAAIILLTIIAAGRPKVRP